MELTVRTGDFLNELTLMQGVVERKNTIPILSNILLKAADGHLSFTSTDLDLTLLSQAEAKVVAAGQRDGSRAQALRPDPQPARGGRRPEADGQPLPGRRPASARRSGSWPSRPRTFRPCPKVEAKTE